MNKKTITKKVLVDKGTLEFFKDCYEVLENQEFTRPIASQLIPVGESGLKDENKLTQIYEFVIYYDEYTMAKEAVEGIQKQQQQQQQPKKEATKEEVDIEL